MTLFLHTGKVRFEGVISTGMAVKKGSEPCPPGVASKSFTEIIVNILVNDFISLFL